MTLYRAGGSFCPAFPGGSEQDVLLDHPVPVYLTYLTAVRTPKGVAFRPDV